MSELITLAGIAWDPQIRGILTVATGAVVLMGSVWLIVSTNSGTRLGTLISVAGFFGWMLVMGIVWWIYGIGLTGDSPTWQPKEIVYGDLSQSESDVQNLGSNQITVTPATQIVDQYCPGLVEATVQVQRARYVEENVDLPLQYDAPKPYCTESIGEKLAVDAETLADTTKEANDLLISDAERSGIEDSRILDEEALQSRIDTVIDDQQRKLRFLVDSRLPACTGIPTRIVGLPCFAEALTKGRRWVSSRSKKTCLKMLFTKYSEGTAMSDFNSFTTLTAS